MNHGVEIKDVPDEPPPVLGNWPRVYAFVLAYLAAIIGLMYVFTVTFTS